MEKKMNNKGFSLVELIIVVAIMAVLIGVLAPAYLQYVEKSKKTSDCTAIGSIMDAIEVVASDPSITWTAGSGNAISVSINKSPNASTITANGDGPSAAVLKIIEVDGTYMTSGWAALTFTATKDADGFVEFKITAGPSKSDIDDISPVLANRFE